MHAESYLHAEVQRHRKHVAHGRRSEALQKTSSAALGEYLATM
jgi:hypothetical protein